MHHKADFWTININTLIRSCCGSSGICHLPRIKISLQDRIIRRCTRNRCARCNISLRTRNSHFVINNTGRTKCHVAIVGQYIIINQRVIYLRESGQTCLVELLHKPKLAAHQRRNCDGCCLTNGDTSNGNSSRSSVNQLLYIKCWLVDSERSFASHNCLRGNGTYGANHTAAGICNQRIRNRWGCGPSHITRVLNFNAELDQITDIGVIGLKRGFCNRHGRGSSRACKLYAGGGSR